MKYKKYPKVKDSGVEWIGEIPEGWEVKKLKFVANFDNSTVDRHVYDDEIPVSISHYPQVYHNETISLKTELPKGTCSQKEFENFRLKKDDVLITKDSESADDIGVPVYILDDFLDTVCGYHIAQLSTDKKQLFGGFLFRFIQSSNVNGYFETEANGVTRYGLGKDSISNLIIPLPPKLVQEQIYHFLENKTTQFDELIAKFKAQIILLEEKKQATINQAVTKGLDPSVPMKDSGVDWIGDIPKTWEIVPLFSVCKDNKKKNFGNKIKNVLSLSYGKIKRRDVETNFGLLPDSFETYQILDDGDIVLRLTDLQNDKRSLRVGLVTEKGIITSAYTGLKVSNSINSDYLYNLLHFYDLEKVFYGLGSGVRQSMNFSDLKRLPLVIPTKNESDEISEFLQKQTTQFDELIAKSKTQITLLEEKRQALITATVTGKIDVRGVMA
jgi:type I restriction enzyme, S subunit